MRNRFQGRNVFPQIHTVTEIHKVAIAAAIDKWVWPPSCAQTLFEQYTKLTLVDHTTKHRQTTATSEAVEHDDHTNERCT